MWNIWVNGATNFKRGGDSCFSTVGDQVLAAKLNMEVNGISATGDASYRVKVGFIRKTFKGSVSANLNRIRIRVGLQADVKNKRLSITEYAVEEMSGFNVKVKVRGFFGIFNSLINRFIPKNKIADKVKDAIREQLDKQVTRFTAWDKIPV